MTIHPPSPIATAPLYTRKVDPDSERMSGSQVHYASFDDFVTAFHAEANDPNRIGMADMLDVVNPLQHLPVIGTIYREITGDHLKPAAEMIGDTLFGGGIGLATSSVKVAVKDEMDRTAQKTATDKKGDPVGAIAFMETELPPSAYAAELSEERPLAPSPLPKHTQNATEAIAGVIHRAIAEDYQKGAAAYTRMTMEDPERTAGSIPCYA